MFASMEATVRAGTLTAIAAGLVGIKVGMAGIAAVFTKHPILSAIFLGTMVGGELGKRLEKDADMTEKYRETVEDLNYDMLENLTVQEEAGVSLLTMADAQGKLNETLEEFPDLEPLAEKIGLIKTQAGLFGDEAGNAKNGLAAFEEQAANANFSGIEGRFRALFERIHDVRAETALLIDGMTQLEKAQALMTPENVLQKGVTDQMKVAYDVFLKGLKEETDQGTSEAATDFVGNFFDAITEGIEKESARLDLQSLGLSAALIDQILGREGWDEVFQAIIDGGEEMARELQDDFDQTVVGAKILADQAKELADQLEELTLKET